MVRGRETRAQLAEIRAQQSTEFRGHRNALLRSVLLSAIVLALMICRPQPVWAQSKPVRSFESLGNEFVTPETQKAIDKGIVFLSNRQFPDGSFGSGSNYKRNVAVTSLAGMAFLSAGHMPGRGPYGKNVDKSVDYILSCVSPSGFIKRDDSPEHGPMYGHGFATLYLAEVYGMSPNEKVREALKSATQLIINSQNKEGGWRYKPDGKDADVSVTVCQMMALRAARNCGIAVPKTTVDNCVEYVRKCQNGDGGFRYQLSGRPMSDFPRSAAGIVVMYNAGVTESRDVERGLAYLLRSTPSGNLLRHDPHYFYGQYYAVQAMWHAGEDYWRQWYPAIRDELINRQLPDGGWADSTVNNEYATAMSCLILQMPNNLLPIFQR
jgi:prenyltransferase beta subunit